MRRPRRLRLALSVVVVAALAALGLAAPSVSAQNGAVFTVDGRGNTDDGVVQVLLNNTSFATIALTSTSAQYTVPMPAGTEWQDIKLFWPDGLNGQGVNMDVSFTAFSLDGDTRGMIAGDVLVSGQWDSAASACTPLGDPIDIWLRCQGLVQFPEEGAPPPNIPPLDPSYWGSATTQVPVYDTAWDFGLRGTASQAATYSQFLRNSGFSGIAVSYLSAIHGLNVTDPNGNPGANVAPNGELIVDAGYANRFEDLLDEAHAEGLRVLVVVAFERKWVHDFGLITEANAYSWGFQIADRFAGHPAIQAWTLGADAADDDPKTQLWTNMADGLRDAGATEDINYHTGSSPLRRVANLYEPWNQSQLVQTSHCASTAEAKARLEGVIALASIPVWAGEMRYEGIEATWCVPYNGVVTPQDVLDDAVGVVDSGASAILYGHNDRWQWGHGVLGGGNQGWTTVQASFDDPGQHLAISALQVDGCNGLEVTIMWGPGVVATSGDDVILGTEGADTIAGLGGADTICGLGGADIINGGGGVDTIFGGAGDDVIGGQGGDDVLYGDGDDDLINGGVGNDEAWGGPGDDDLRGQGDDDVLWGEAGVDQFFGGSGDDIIHTGSGGNLGTAQRVSGQGNNDMIFGGDGNDDLEGISGTDELHGGAGDDRLRGGNALDRLWGDAGNDTLEGGANRDFLYGGDDDDLLTGGTGDDDLFGEAGDDSLNGQGGTDLCDGGTGGESLGDTANLDTCETVANVP